MKYYGSTRSFASLRETIYQTKANMPIVPISGKLERIDRANAKISHYSNINVRVELDSNLQ